MAVDSSEDLLARVVGAEPKAVPWANRQTLLMGLVRPTEAMQGKQTTKQAPTTGRQAIFDPEVVVRRRDEGDVIEIEPAGVCRRFGKIVFAGGKIKGPALVHRWTPHKTHRPHTILLPLNSDFWEGLQCSIGLGAVGVSPSTA